MKSLEYIEFNNKRIGPVRSEMFKFLNSKIKYFDDFDIVGDEIYIEQNKVKYLFNLRDIKSLNFEKITEIPAIDENSSYSLVLDVGASYGYFSIPNASKNTKFISVEYNPKIYNNFLKNIQLNKKTGFIQPIMINKNLNSNKPTSKNIREITELTKIIDIVGFENINLIRFDSRIDEISIENFLNIYKEIQLPKFIISDNKFIKFKNGKIFT